VKPPLPGRICGLPGLACQRSLAIDRLLREQRRSESIQVSGEVAHGCITKSAE
jgi:hypothetical protein